MIPTIPAQGQLVTVRQRRFVVNEVRESSLPPDPFGGPGMSTVQHLLQLASIEDDGLGEELEIVWEIEPGRRVYERATLPDPTRGFDEPRRLEAFLDAVRWGAISSADVGALHAPFRSGIAIEDYQLDPVVRALSMPRVNLLIADDVGLGKTIEAGLVVQELLLRHRARTVLVVCPAAIQIQWRDQMRDKFGLDFRIVDSELMRELRRRRGLHVNPWTHFPRLITSIDFLKRERPMRLMRDALPPEGQPVYPRRFDLLIVDEAHNVAPSGRGAYALDSLRTDAIRTLAPHFEHKLFLSATPHNGYPESFSALLELLDNQRFHRGVRPDRQQLAAIMVRRMKSELPPTWDGRERFAKRELRAIEVAYSDEERRAHHALVEYARLRRAEASRDAERFATEFVLKLLKKRLFSSPAAFGTTLEQHRRSLALAKKRVKKEASAPSVGLLRRMVDGLEDEQYADDDEYEAAGEEAIESTTRLFREVSAEEKRLLDELARFAEKASARPDAKAEELLAWLRRLVKPGKTWTENRVIIFTEYRATQKWLMQLLAGAGFIEGERVMTLYGGMQSEDRERIKAAFQASPDKAEVRILLATDAASEGIDLQNHCSRLIHYEIPWNPNRLEQRNGRVDRHGQRHPVVIHHFVGKGWESTRANRETAPGSLEGDVEFLFRAALKIDTIREDLGKVGPVIASQVEEAMLGKRQRLDTERAMSDAGEARALLKVERKIREQLQKLQDRLKTSREELHLAPENIQAVVEVGLALADQPALIPVKLKGLWPDPEGRRTASPVFQLPALKGSWALCAEGLAHPHTQEIRPVVFDHALAEGRDDVVLAHLNHRLVQMCLGLLRAEIWSSAGEEGASARSLYRVTVRLVPDKALELPAVIAHGRLVVLGADNARLHEEVIAAGGLLREGRFVKMGAADLKAALGAAVEGEVPAATRDKLAKLWPTHRDGLLAALEARMKERTGSLEKLLAERAEKEAADLRHVLEELKRTIEEEFKKEGPQQLAFDIKEFSDPEREQFERNKASLLARARAIPGEIERESRALRARYEKPVPRLFPVAVTYLVPERVARADRGRS